MSDQAMLVVISACAITASAVLCLVGRHRVNRHKDAFDVLMSSLMLTTVSFVLSMISIWRG